MKPDSTSALKPARSSAVKPCARKWLLGFERSRSVYATFKTPQKMTGLLVSNFVCICASFLQTEDLRLCLVQIPDKRLRLARTTPVRIPRTQFHPPTLSQTTSFLARGETS